MVGAALVYKGLKPPHLNRFRRPEPGAMPARGMAQEIAVEPLSISGGTWAYQPRWHNPSPFQLKDSHFTLWPVLIWVAAPAVSYPAALAINRKRGSSRGGGTRRGPMSHQAFMFSA